MDLLQTLIAEDEAREALPVRPHRADWVADARKAQSAARVAARGESLANPVQRDLSLAEMGEQDAMERTARDFGFSIQ